MSRDSAIEGPGIVRYGPGDDRESTSTKGTYVLVFEVTGAVSVEVGALGRVDIPAGDYAYVGSAFGPGGFARVDRHRHHLSGGDDTVHWHIDALTTHPATSFRFADLVPGRDVECAVARHLPPGPCERFGASDCDCRSHLSRVDHETVGREVRAALEELEDG